jgi:hypothetical protein
MIKNEFGFKKQVKQGDINGSSAADSSKIYLFLKTAEILMPRGKPRPLQTKYIAPVYRADDGSELTDMGQAIRM